MVTTTRKRKTVYNTQEAAEALNVDDSRVRQILLAGQLQGEKLNARAWVIMRAAIQRYAKEYDKEVTWPD